MGFEAWCRICGHSTRYNDAEQARRAMTWHVFEEHREDWVSVCGDRAPFDPKPHREFR